MSKLKQKPYWEMATAELGEATKEFDQEFVATQPLTPADRAQLRRARIKAKHAASQTRAPAGSKRMRRKAG